MELEYKDKLVRLYDLYQDLLTEKQRQIFVNYYFDDLSLFEIAENENVSRNAVFSLIHRVEKILLKYESKLHLLEKYNKINETLEKAKVDEKVINKITKIMEE